MFIRAATPSYLNLSARCCAGPTLQQALLGRSTSPLPLRTASPSQNPRVMQQMAQGVLAAYAAAAAPAHKARQPSPAPLQGAAPRRAAATQPQERAAAATAAALDADTATAASAARASPQAAGTQAESAHGGGHAMTTRGRRPQGLHKLRPTASEWSPGCPPSPQAEGPAANRSSSERLPQQPAAAAAAPAAGMAPHFAMPAPLLPGGPLVAGGCMPSEPSCPPWAPSVIMPEVCWAGVGG